MSSPAIAIDQVEVEPHGDGGLEVRWRWVGEPPPGEVVISAGPTPDHIDHDHPLVTAPAAAGRVRLDAFTGGPRTYFHVGGPGVSGLIGAERRIPLEGSMNFRDLGGYPTDGGGRVRWGKVFRSDGLGLLTDADLGLLEHLGIRVIHDFRRPSERLKAPSRYPAGSREELATRIEVMELSIGGDAAEVDFLDRLLAGEIKEAGVDFMTEMYLTMLREDAPTFGRLLESLSRADRLPALFHCTAGKDRTGLAAALLLGVLGVSHEDILADYELSNRYRAERRIAELRPRLEAAGVDVEAVRPFLSAPRPALEASLGHVVADHGSVTEFVLGQAGVTAETIIQLERLLVETP